MERILKLLIFKLESFGSLWYASYLYFSSILNLTKVRWQRKHIFPSYPSLSYHKFQFTFYLGKANFLQKTWLNIFSFDFRIFNFPPKKEYEEYRHSIYIRTVSSILYNLFVTSRKRNYEFTNSRIQSAVKCLLEHKMFIKGNK